MVHTQGAGMPDFLSAIQNEKHVDWILLKEDSGLRRNYCIALLPEWGDGLFSPENQNRSHKLFSSRDS